MNYQLNVKDLPTGVDGATIRMLAEQLFSCASGVESDFCFATICNGEIQHYAVPNRADAVDRIVALAGC